MSLRRRLLNAGAWTTGAFAFEFGIRLLSNIIMTRLLFPEAFGLAAASGSIIIGLTLISDFGVHAVIIQSERGETDGFLRSAWTFQAIRGLILWSFLIIFCAFISAPVVRASFSSDSVFADRTFAPLTVALGFTLVLHGLESTAIALNIRRLQYRSIALIEVVGKLCAVPVMIGSALIVPSVWALAIGALAGGGVRVVLSHWSVPGPRMAFEWDKQHIREIVHFGKWITISSIATFVGSQSDVILFGALFPSAYLGLYFIAKSIIDVIEGLMDRLNSTLTLPVLGEVLRNNANGLRDRYYQFRLPIELIGAVCGGIVFATADQIIRVLYDERYLSAGVMLKLLSLGLAIYPFQLIRSAFTAVGKTRIVAMVSIIQAVALVSLLILGYLAFGALGAIAGVAINRLIPSAVILHLSHGRKWTSIWREIRIIPLFLAGYVAGESILVIGKSLGPTSIQYLFR